MAVFKNGPNGSFSGKVGSVVGYKWKGLDVIRGLPRKSHKPRSEARLANEQAMKRIMEVLQPLKVFIRIGFRDAAASLNMSAFNLALSLNKKNALKGEYPNLEIDWTKLQVSQGELPGPKELTAVWTAAGLRIMWHNNAGQSHAHVGDLLSFVIYSVSLDQWFPFFNESTRDAGECTIEADEDWAGTEVHAFCTFMSFGGEVVSDSAYFHLPAETR
ncbi:DUF6266 family protein [Parapedobacter sp. DT-150]|uniref:DUF6266 family protein n=1 Tax=Parapedobacter sp. DT-150 TaxID=3396162 RepID=UPI003F1D833B